jgi:hypothetical protein
MNYEDARNKIKTGDMLLFRYRAGVGLRANVERWLVSHGTASPYTHVGVAWSEHGRNWCMDMTTKGCAPRLLSSCGDFDLACSPMPLNEEALGFAFSQFGELQYSRLRAIGGALGLIDIKSEHESMCAEYALTIYKKAGFAPSEIATPAMLAVGAAYNWGVSTVVIKNGGPK